MRLADLDPDLLAPAAEQIDLVDAGGEQPFANVPGLGTKRDFREGPRDDDVADVLVKEESLDDRFLGVLRQRLDLAHGVLDACQRRIEVRTRLELDEDRADAFHRLREDPLDPVEKADLRLDRRDDVGVDVLGACAGPGDVDRDPFDAKIGEELGVHAHEPERAEQHHQHHHKVGSGAMAREQRNHTAPG